MTGVYDDTDFLFFCPCALHIDSALSGEKKGGGEQAEYHDEFQLFFHKKFPEIRL